jgi:hypothetical protein
MTVLSGFSFPGSPRSGSLPAGRAGSAAGLMRFFANRRVLSTVAVALMAGALAGCSSTGKGPPKPCPAVSIEPSLAYKTEFAGNGRDLSDIAYEARAEMPLQPLCWYSHDQDKDYIRTAFNLQFNAVRGPKFSGDKASFKYFVAVTGPGGVLVEKQLFDVDVDFSKGQVRSFTTDQIDPIKIFPKPNENGDFYRIYVGLDLTKDQLDYNKRNPRQ